MSGNGGESGAEAEPCQALLDLLGKVVKVEAASACGGRALKLRPGRFQGIYHNCPPPNAPAITFEYPAFARSQLLPSCLLVAVGAEDLATRTSTPGSTPEPP